MWKKIFAIFIISTCFFIKKVESQTLTYTFVDPCTNQISYFSVPATGTTITFLNQSAVFTSDDVANGNFGNWVNTVYTNYRNLFPCPTTIQSNQTVLQTNQSIQNQITIQIIGNTVQSIVSNILGSLNQSMSMVDNNVSSDNSQSSGGDDAASKGKTESDKQKKNDNKTNNSNTNSVNTNAPSGTNTENNQTIGGNNNNSTNTTTNNQNTTNNSNNNNTNVSNDNQTNTSSNQTNQTTNSNSISSSNNQATNSNNISSNNQATNNNTDNNISNSTTTNNSNSNGTMSNNSSNTNTTANATTNTSDNQTQQPNQENEVAASTNMTVDALDNRGNDNSSSSSSSSSGNKSSKANQSVRSNPIIVSSDLTSAQNLNKSFTGILNIGMSKSSLTGKTSKGLTSMTWFNMKQFALSAKYTKTHKNKKGTLKWVNNLNLTSVYSYGNILGFFGYSSILNAKKYGIAGFNMSIAATLVTKSKSSFFSPSITAFYTKPFKGNKKLTISPELYVISTPLIYSTKDKVTQTDRYFSGFIGSGFDYQITKRFKVNLNYKANMSTNPQFPILSFFLIGSKINL